MILIATLFVKCIDLSSIALYLVNMKWMVADKEKIHTSRRKKILQADDYSLLSEAALYFILIALIASAKLCHSICYNTIPSLHKNRNSTTATSFFSHTKKNTLVCVAGHARWPPIVWKPPLMVIEAFLGIGELEETSLYEVGFLLRRTPTAKSSAMIFVHS